jgi:hypothetical protein
MKRPVFLIALGLATTLATLPAAAGPASRIVGLWHTQALVGPCGAPPSIPIQNYLLFNAGGTIVEMFLMPPSQTAFRTYGLGTWSYTPATNRHALRLRFDRFDDGGNRIGYSTVNRQLTLSADGQHTAGPVHVVHYDVDGNPLGELCGEAVSDRL